MVNVGLVWLQLLTSFLHFPVVKRYALSKAMDRVSCINLLLLCGSVGEGGPFVGRWFDLLLDVLVVLILLRFLTIVIPLVARVMPEEKHIMIVVTRKHPAGGILPEDRRCETRDDPDAYDKYQQGVKFCGALAGQRNT